MIEYPKIETLYNRDILGTKKLVEGDFRSESIEYLKNNQWIFTEKIDGTNIRIEWDGHKIKYGGRTDRANIPAHLMNVLVNMFGGETNEEVFEQLFGDSHVILYGEGYGPKIQKGGNYRSDPSFILFDVYFPDSNLWLKREALEDVAKTLGIDIVPIVGRGTIEEAVEYVKTKPKSTFGAANMEGVVCKPEVDLLDRRGKRLIVKVKVCDFA